MQRRSGAVRVRVRVGFNVGFELVAVAATARTAAVIARPLTAGTVLSVLLILRVEVVESVRHDILRIDRFL